MEGGGARGPEQSMDRLLGHGLTVTIGIWCTANCVSSSLSLYALLASTAG